MTNFRFISTCSFFLFLQKNLSLINVKLYCTHIWLCCSCWHLASEPHVAHYLLGNHARKDLMIEEHTLPSLWQCLLVGLIAGPLWIYEQIQVAAQTNRACKTAWKEKKTKNPKTCSYAAYSILGYPHTEIWHITSGCVCKQCAPHFLWLFHNQKKSLFGQKHVQKQWRTLIPLSSPTNTLCIVCAGMSFSLMKWSNSESLCGLILCFCADVTYGCN